MKNNFTILIMMLMVSIFVTNTAIAQVFTNYTTATTSNTLCNNHVTAIAIDAQGNKWIGTGGGVSELSAETTTELNPVINKNLLTLYPNPVQNQLHINLPGKTGMLEVFDGTGKLVLQKQINDNHTSIDVSSIEHGIYFVKVLSDKQMFTGKFVKH